MDGLVYGEARGSAGAGRKWGQEAGPGGTGRAVGLKELGLGQSGQRRGGPQRNRAQGQVTEGSPEGLGRSGTLGTGGRH